MKHQRHKYFLKNCVAAVVIVVAGVCVFMSMCVFMLMCVFMSMCVCMLMCVCVYTEKCMERSKGNFGERTLFFTPDGPSKDGTQVTRLARQASLPTEPSHQPHPDALAFTFVSVWSSSALFSI